MSYFVELELDDVACFTQADAIAACATIAGDVWAAKRFRVASRSLSFPERDDAWGIEVNCFDGGNWHEPSARRAWLALAPFVRDGSTLHFRHEDGARYRIRWEAGRVFEDFPKHIEWAVECEITSHLLDE